MNYGQKQYGGSLNIWESISSPLEERLCQQSITTLVVAGVAVLSIFICMPCLIVA